MFITGVKYFPRFYPGAPRMVSMECDVHSSHVKDRKPASVILTVPETLQGQRIRLTSPQLCPNGLWGLSRMRLSRQIETLLFYMGDFSARKDSFRPIPSFVGTFVREILKSFPRAETLGDMPRDTLTINIDTRKLNERALYFSWHTTKSRDGDHRVDARGRIVLNMDQSKSHFIPLSSL